MLDNNFNGVSTTPINTIGTFSGLARDNYGDSTSYSLTPTSTATLTNKTFDTAGTGNTFKVNGNSITGVSGNTATVATTSGTLTSTHCVEIDANGNLVDAGGTCTTGGGGGTVSSGTAGQVTYYAGTGTTVSGEALTALIDSAIGSTQGDVLYRGASSWAVLAPGTSGYFLETQGASANPTWAPVSGSGTVNSGTAAQFAYYAGSGTAVSGSSSFTTATVPTLSAGNAFTGNETHAGTETYTAATIQRPIPLSVSGGAIATNAAVGNNFRVTPTHSTSTTMSVPTNPADGQKITYEIVQDSTGSGTISWDAVFAFGTTGAPTLTTTASKRDLVGFQYSSDETKWLYLGSQLGL